MSYRRYILKFALETKDGEFYCKLCGEWVDMHRWVHFKGLHRYKKPLSL
jgi:hypothetical protein